MYIIIYVFIYRWYVFLHARAPVFRFVLVRQKSSDDDDDDDNDDDDRRDFFHYV